MARWLTLALLLLVAALAAAAAGPAAMELRESRGVPDAIVPTLPWAAPTADARPAAAAPTLVAPPPRAESGAESGAAPPAPSQRVAERPSKPGDARPSSPTPKQSASQASAPAAPPASATALAIVDHQWYEEPQRELSPATARLYLDRMLNGEVVEGWDWDAGYKVEDAAAGFEDQPSTQPLSFGLEGRLERSTARNEDGDFIDAYMVGPSMNWQPSPRTQLEFAPLVGIAAPYPMSEVVVAFGWKF